MLVCKAPSKVSNGSFLSWTARNEVKLAVYVPRITTATNQHEKITTRELCDRGKVAPPGGFVKHNVENILTFFIRMVLRKFHMYIFIFVYLLILHRHRHRKSRIYFLEDAFSVIFLHHFRTLVFLHMKSVSHLDSWFRYIARYINN